MIIQLQSELEGIAAQVLALAIQCDPDTDRLTDKAMQDALFAMQHHILRIAEDVGKLEVCPEGRTE